MVYQKYWFPREETTEEQAPEAPPPPADAGDKVIIPPKPSEEQPQPQSGGTSIYFAPGQNPEKNIIGFMDRTKDTLDIAIYSFTSPEITEAVKKAFARGVKIRLLMDAAQGRQTWSAYRHLAPILALWIRLDKKSSLMHHKFAISDMKAIIIGSYNWSENAEKNYENMIIVRDQGVINTFQTEFEKIWQENK